MCKIYISMCFYSEKKFFQREFFFFETKYMLTTCILFRQIRHMVGAIHCGKFKSKFLPKKCPDFGHFFWPKNVPILDIFGRKMSRFLTFARKMSRFWTFARKMSRFWTFARKMSR